MMTTEKIEIKKVKEALLLPARAVGWLEKSVLYCVVHDLSYIEIELYLTLKQVILISN